jgi:hypothetical protein
VKVKELIVELLKEDQEDEANKYLIWHTLHVVAEKQADRYSKSDVIGAQIIIVTKDGKHHHTHVS